jgi:H+/gluconate symporter-like permease
MTEHVSTRSWRPSVSWDQVSHTVSPIPELSSQAVISALSSRYIPIVLFPYYIALGAQFISSLYAIIFVPETLQKSSKQDEEESEEEEEDDDESETVMEALTHHVVEPVVDAVVEPVKPLALLLPHRGKHGSLEWRLFILTMSLLATTSGVGHFWMEESTSLISRPSLSRQHHYCS